MNKDDGSVATICQRCGACCACYRVSFYWTEEISFSLPASHTEKLNEHLLCMAGTNSSSPRCVALVGEPGKRVSCSLYAQRPSPCREVQVGDARCNRSRLRYGLPAISAAVPADSHSGQVASREQP